MIWCGQPLRWEHCARGAVPHRATTAASARRGCVNFVAVVQCRLHAWRVPVCSTQLHRACTRAAAAISYAQAPHTMPPCPHSTFHASARPCIVRPACLCPGALRPVPSKQAHPATTTSPAPSRRCGTASPSCPRSRSTQARGCPSAPSMTRTVRPTGRQSSCAPRRLTSLVRIVRRSIPPQWGSIRFRLAPRTYDARPMWALSTRGARPPNDIKKNTHPKIVTGTALFCKQAHGRRTLGSRPRSGLRWRRARWCRTSRRRGRTRRQRTKPRAR